MAEKEKIRPIYSELQGYLSQAPMTSEKYPSIHTDSMWEQVNKTITELNNIADADYNRFTITPQEGQLGTFVTKAAYRATVGGLISRLHGEYFSDEPAPFSGMPSTVITQTQQQSQSFQVELVFEMVSKIEKQLQQLDAEDKRYGFLEKVKGALKSVRNATELIALYVTTAKEFGLTLEELTGLFK